MLGALLLGCDIRTRVAPAAGRKSICTQTYLCRACCACAPPCVRHHHHQSPSLRPPCPHLQTLARRHPPLCPWPGLIYGSVACAAAQHVTAQHSTPHNSAQQKQTTSILHANSDKQHLSTPQTHIQSHLWHADHAWPHHEHQEELFGASGVGVVDNQTA